MKRFILIQFIVVFLISHICAYNDEIHQYIVREAYKLLKLQVPPIEEPDLANHVGDNEKGDGPWLEGLIVTGAAREDYEEPLYCYGNSGLFGLELSHQTTFTHFWLLI